MNFLHAFLCQYNIDIVDYHGCNNSIVLSFNLLPGPVVNPSKSRNIVELSSVSSP